MEGASQLQKTLLEWACSYSPNIPVKLAILVLKDSAQRGMGALTSPLAVTLPPRTCSIRPETCCHLDLLL